MERKTIYDLTEALRTIGAEFRSRMDAIKREYEENVKTMPQKYIGTEYTKRREAASVDYDLQCEKMRSEYREMYAPIVEELELTARAKAGIVSEKIINEVGLFKDIPLTSDEFGALAKNFGGLNYYGDRLLVEIAKKNNIEYAVTPIGEVAKIEPDLKTKLEVLESLVSQAEHLLTTYNTVDADTFSRIGDLFPATLTNLENIYTNGLLESEKTVKQKALQVMGEITRNPGVAVNNIDYILSSLDEETKEAVMYEISKTDVYKTKALAEKLNIKPLKTKTGNYSELDAEFYSKYIRITNFDEDVFTDEQTKLFKQMFEE